MSLPYSPNWGRKAKSTGYTVVYCPEHPRAWSTGYVYEHVLVMEAQLGRLLLPNEVVHHRDECKTNNAVDNLELLTRSAHAKKHVKRTNPLTFVCAYCRSPFTRAKNQSPIYKGTKRTFCSRSCNGKSHKAATVPVA